MGFHLQRVSGGSERRDDKIAIAIGHSLAHLRGQLVGHMNHGRRDNSTRRVGDGSDNGALSV
jgi:hypothetical protein